MAAVATRLHVSDRTVKRQLPALIQHGLVKPDGDKFVGITDADLDDIAQRVGATGYRDDLRSRFAVEQADNRQERLDWYSAKVRAEAETKREFDAIFAAIAEESAEKMRALTEHWKDPRTIPDPFETREQQLREQTERTNDHN